MILNQMHISLAVTNEYITSVYDDYFRNESTHHLNVQCDIELITY